ncbi:hypothetical protein AVEN_219287-1 [Araneus ventricosus]|uniref:Uncharacterized protein n=1 Tax=Araneus ventricosus TaxID=182803 RepID=A0A4Y2BGC9_ARAVE|nr:hypothetical protein AVEN_219287-1 [Araneus ventricosus]
MSMDNREYTVFWYPIFSSRNIPKKSCAQPISQTQFLDNQPEIGSTRDHTLSMCSSTHEIDSRPGLILPILTALTEIIGRIEKNSFLQWVISINGSEPKHS